MNNDMPQRRGRRRMTVNQRIDMELDGTFRNRKMNEKKSKATAQDMLSWKRMSVLYNVGVDNRFIKKRITKSPTGLVDELPKSPQRIASSSPSATDFPFKELHSSTRTVTPWYVGYRNSTASTPHSPLAKAQRYGAQSTIQLLAVRSNSPPANLNRCQSLDFLDTSYHPDHYESPLKESPSLWPKESAHPTGGKLDFRITRANVAQPKPKAQPVLKVAVPRRQNDELKHLEKAWEKERLDRRKEMKKTTIHLKEVFEKRKKERLEFAVRARHKADTKPLHDYTLIHTPNKQVLRRETERIDEFKERRFELKWKYHARFNEILRQKSSRQPILRVIDKIISLALEKSVDNINPYELNRDQFVSLLMNEYTSMTVTEASRLYSAYDPERQDRVDAREFVATLKALRLQGSMKSVLLELFTTFDVTSKGHLYYALVKKIFILACDSIQEEAKIIALADTAFESETRRPKDHDVISRNEFKALVMGKSPLVQAFTESLKKHKKAEES